MLTHQICLAIRYAYPLDMFTIRYAYPLDMFTIRYAYPLKMITHLPSQILTHLASLRWARWVRPRDRGDALT